MSVLLQMWYLLLGLLALLIVSTWYPREFMTNADVQKKLDFHASKPTSWNMKKDNESNENRLMGPRIPSEQEKEVEEAKQKNTSDSSSVYPEVYGPERAQVPGHSGQEGIFQDTYTSFAEFPAGPKEPQPYLGNYSKFQK